MRARTALAVAVSTLLPLAFLTGACGERDDGTAAYFLDGYLAPAGFRGQLRGVERDAATPRDVVGALLRGPSLEERRSGLVTTIPPGTRLGRVAVADGVRVDLTGSEEPSFDAAAQLVYSLTELPGIKRVSLRFNGKPCCVYTHDGQPVEVLTRASFRGWQGEPCELRESPSAPCGSDRRLVPGRFERPTLEGNIEGTNPRRRVGRARYAVRSARCRGEGRIIEGARFYACRITWTDGHSRRVCVGRSLRPGSSHAYLPLGRCQRPRTPPPAGVDP